MAGALSEGKKAQLTYNVQQIFSYFKNPPQDSYEFTEQLQRSIGPFIPYQAMTHASKMKLCEDNPLNSRFLRKFDELKLKNAKEVDPLVMLLAKMKENPEVMGALTQLYEQEGGRSGMQTPTSTDSHEERVAASGRPRGLFAKTLNLKEMRSDIEKNLESNALPAPGEPLPHGVKYHHRAKSTGAADMPWQPDWLFSRPYQGFNYVLEDYEVPPPLPTVENLPPLAQESVLVHDLIYLLHGEEGVYIKPLPLASPMDTRTFHIDACFQGSLREVACDVLLVCANYSTVAQFMHEKSAFEYGAVNKALCSALVQLTRDYEVLLCQLEQQHHRGQLQCAQVHFYLREPGQLLRALAELCRAINQGQCIGGKVLSVLYDKCRAFTGEAQLFEIFHFLIREACVPYFEQLQRWIYRGIVADPFKEFFIVESDCKLKDKKTMNREYINKFWEEHYTVNRSQIPNFLEPLVEKILKTGKYLNVIQQCGNKWEFPNSEALHFAMNDARYVEQIERAYLHASNLVLELMRREYKLSEHLQSLKHFFLLDRGDFMVHFMDVAEKELCKSAKFAKVSRLEALLEIALRTSTANVDPNKDNLKVELLSYDLISHISNLSNIRGQQLKSKGGREQDMSSVTDMNLTALEAFSLDYEVQWPVSLVLNRQMMDRYQLLFRQLFYCKHVERLLGRVWLIQQTAKRRSVQSTGWLSTSYALRARMLSFVQHLEYYMTFEVVEPNWGIFMDQVREAKNLDGILEVHQRFITVCLQDSMLEDHALLNLVHKLLLLCVQFANFVHRMSRSSDLSTQGVSTSLIMDDATMDTSMLPNDMDASMWKAGSSYENTVETFDQNFSRFLRDLLCLIEAKSDRHLSVANLLLRLNYNGFYSSSATMTNSAMLQMDYPPPQKPPQQQQHRITNPPPPSYISISRSATRNAHVDDV